MSTSAFKSTSKRGVGGAAAETKAPPPSSTSRRRSHSVAAVSRKNHPPIDDKTLAPFEFSNSRDNPLFWSTPSPLPNREESCIGKDKQSDSLNSRNSTTVNSNGYSSREQRGRPVTRSVSERNGIGSRSLSRARGRSLSRVPSQGAYGSEKEQGTFTSTIAQSRNEIKRIDNGIQRTIPIRYRVDRRGQAMNAKATKIQSQGIEWSEDDSACSMQISNQEDGISIGSLSEEAEDKNVKATSNKAFLRNNVINTCTATHVADTPSDFLNPEVVELFSEVRKEYAMKLEESEERTRKLRADLAIEERRGKELGRILKEMLPDQKTYGGLHRSRHGRRISNERKRMSKCLSEDAMAYFDECVSLSTFDSSDLSASEEPPCYSSGGATLPGVAASSSLVKGSFELHQKQLHGYEDSETGSTSLVYNFTFADKKFQPEVEDIRSYIKNFEKATNKEAMTSSYYEGEVDGESMLIDRVLYNRRIESGSFLLCSFSPFV